MERITISELSQSKFEFKSWVLRDNFASPSIPCVSSMFIRGRKGRTNLRQTWASSAVVVVTQSANSVSEEESYDSRGSTTAKKDRLADGGRLDGLA